MSRSRVALVAAVAAASLTGWWLGTDRSENGGGLQATVTAVRDGDTIEVAWADRRETVRLLGVDTPETVAPDRPVECHGPEASAFTKERLLGREVSLTFDRERRDRYGRLLAFVAVEGKAFNEELLALGHARLLIVPPNGARARSMLDLELEARAAGRGLWGAC